MTTYVKNYGMIQNYVKSNDKTITTGAKWIGDYDGTVANVDIDVNNNGYTEHAHLQLDNDDLLHILNMEAIDRPIDQRLQNDFLLDMPPYIKYPYKLKRPKSNFQKHTKRRRLTKSKKNKRSRKMDSLIQLSSL